MKKLYIRLIACIFLLIIFLSTTIYAAGKYPDGNADFDTIYNYYESVNGDISDVPTVVLEKWYKTAEAKAELTNLTAQDKRKALRLKEFVNAELTVRGAINMNYWEPAKGGGNGELYSKAGGIVGAIQVFGSVVSVAVLVVIGIKYMLGSVYEKAKYKESMMLYIIGCIMLFGISNIASILYKMATQI